MNDTTGLVLLKIVRWIPITIHLSEVIRALSYSLNNDLAFLGSHRFGSFETYSERLTITCRYDPFTDSLINSDEIWSIFSTHQIEAVWPESWSLLPIDWWKKPEPHCSGSLQSWNKRFHCIYWCRETRGFRYRSTRICGTLLHLPVPPPACIHG